MSNLNVNDSIILVVNEINGKSGGFLYNSCAWLEVSVKKVTDKAVQVAIDNTNYTLWFPKKAITQDENRVYKVASWFDFNDFAKWAIKNYAKDSMISLPR